MHEAWGQGGTRGVGAAGDDERGGGGVDHAGGSGAYGYLPGQPVVARTVWIDQRVSLTKPVVIVDWTSASATHTYSTSLTELMPLAMSEPRLLDGGVLDGAAKITPLLQPGQTVRLDRAQVTTSPPPVAPVERTRYSIAQTGKSAVFIAVLGDVTATLVEPIRRGRPIRILLQVNGQPDRIVSFDPPDLTPPGDAVMSAAVSAARGVAVAPAPTTGVGPSVRAAAFSTRPVDRADVSFLESDADVLR